MDWTKAVPQLVDEPTVVFGPAKIDDFLPPYAVIPEEFKDWNARGLCWNRVVSQWFFGGLRGTLVPKADIDYTQALRHLQACMRSWEPKHERKEAGVAWLMSQWFERYEPGPEEQAYFAGPEE